VASWFGCDMGGFRAAASKMVCRGVVSVHHGAGQGWRCVGRVMPFWCVCSAVQGNVCACGNAAHALHALGCSTVSEWQGRGAMYGGSRSGAARGIDLGGRRGASNEVTAQEVVGVVLPMLGVHGGHGSVLGERGVDRAVTRRWGRGYG
jgi:hypothetical protein